MERSEKDLNVFFCEKLSQSILIGCAEDMYKECKKIIVVDDYVFEMEIYKLFEYIINNPQGLVVIFLNNQRRYLFYNHFPIKIMEYILPFKMKNKEKRNELKMTEDENILYMYATDKETRKEFLTSIIDKSLNGIKPYESKLYLENLYLRGMLDATELKVKQLSDKLSEVVK